MILVLVVLVFGHVSVLPQCTYIMMYYVAVQQYRAVKGPYTSVVQYCVHSTMRTGQDFSTVR